MPALAESTTEHSYNADNEISALISHREKIHSSASDNRHIPAIGDTGKVLIASWKIANVGVHKRRLSGLKVIAEILSWFEIIAVQELADNPDDFLLVAGELPSHFSWIWSDKAGNEGR